jgi:hypothetical protein
LPSTFPSLPPLLYHRHLLPTCPDQNSFGRFEVLTAAVMQTSIFWDITPRTPLKANTSFGGTRHLRLQGRRISQARYRRHNRWQAEKMGGGVMFLRNVS